MVGYSTVATNALNYAGGVMFVPVNPDKDYTELREIKVENMDAGLDSIQLLRTSNATTENSYTYASYEFIVKEVEPETEEDYEDCAAMVGWYKGGYWGKSAYRADTARINVGQGFLTLTMSGNNIKFQYAGEVPNDSTYITTSGLNPMICNYIPRTVTLSEMTVENMDAGLDSFQRLNPKNATTLKSYTYVSYDFAVEEMEPETEEDYEDCAAMVGWYDGGYWGKPAHRADSVEIPAGEGLLGLVGSQNALKVWLPAGVAAAAAAD